MFKTILFGLAIFAITKLSSSQIINWPPLCKGKIGDFCSDSPCCEGTCMLINYKNYGWQNRCTEIPNELP
jgi:hypothetical protein